MSDMSPCPHLTPLLTEKTILFMKLFAALTLLCININATAQTFTQRLQRPVAGKGTVTVVHSAAIDKLVNGNQPVSSFPKRPAIFDIFYCPAGTP